MRKENPEHFRVLAADDEESILQVYRDVLIKRKEDAGIASEISDLEMQLFETKRPVPVSGYSFDLVTCRQGDEAIEAVRQSVEEDRPFALALLDIRMPPGPDGVKTAEAIREMDPLIEILMVTGYSDIDPIEISRRVSPSHKLLYIQKPFHQKEIFQFVRTLCAKWKNDAFIRNYNQRLLSHIEEQTEELKRANQELHQEIIIREESETALRESEEKFRDIFEKSSDHLYLHDLEGNLISTNLAFKTECGYDEEDLHLRNIKDLMPERHRDKFDEYLKRMQEKEHDEGTMTLLTKDGREIIVEYKNSLIRDSLGRPTAVRGAGRDVTERVGVERQKHKLDMHLMRMQRMEAIGTLAGGIAHNFNNLLMGILGNASLAALVIETGHQAQQNLDNIRSLVESGSRLTRQLLEYSKGERHEPEQVSLSQLLRRTAETFNETRRDISIRYRLDDMCVIDADRGQIEQVFLNLLINAADAMPSGGDISLETNIVSAGDIEDKSFNAGSDKYVRLTVTDTGAGMDEDIIEHIFEPFFTTKGLSRGTGLGLASAYGIIKAHGGYIDVRSKKGEGTTFIVYLPASARGAIQRQSEGQDIVYGKETILLVDDEKIILETSERLLCYLGYTVIKAQGGKEAIEVYGADRDRIDLVILDLVMPEVGGDLVFDNLIRIKKDVKVLLSSGYDFDAKAREIMERGCKGFIQKPFDIKELSTIIRTVLK